jgi:hypothetical protein
LWTSTVAAAGPFSLQVPQGLLANCATYYWSVSASNRGGASQSASGIWSFRVRALCDLNADGVIDDSDFVLFAAAYDLYISPGGDFNADGLTDDDDFVIFAAAYNSLLACS